MKCPFFSGDMLVFRGCIVSNQYPLSWLMLSILMYPPWNYQRVLSLKKLIVGRWNCLLGAFRFISRGELLVSVASVTLWYLRLQLLVSTPLKFDINTPLRRNLNIALGKWETSTNHQFLGSMLIFGGVHPINKMFGRKLPFQHYHFQSAFLHISEATPWSVDFFGWWSSC